MNEPIFTPQNFAVAMQIKADYAEKDQERAHRSADELMCDLLISLGYSDGVKIFQDMPKWYS